MINDNEKQEFMDIFIFETFQLVEKLEQIIMEVEEEKSYDNYMNEIFRIMHTIKGSSAVMSLDKLSTLAHSIEDLFFYIREEKPDKLNHLELSDIILNAIDFLKYELSKLENDEHSDREVQDIIYRVNDYLSIIKLNNLSLDETSNKKDNINSKPMKAVQFQPKESTNSLYRIKFYFEENCEMENVRSFSIAHQMEDLGDVISYYPQDIIENNDSIKEIRDNGFQVIISTSNRYDQLEDFAKKVIFIRKYTIEEISHEDSSISQEENLETKNHENRIQDEITNNPKKEEIDKATLKMISVNVNKLDNLMDYVGELVIAESMVTQNPDLMGLNLDNFNKASRRLRKIIYDLQDEVMSVRMVSLNSTFQKMKRLVREMSRKINKEVDLILIGQNTEVDKNIVENVSDPLMHIIRNALDHGLEDTEERLEKGKESRGKIILKAKNLGGKVQITLRDDGRGLNKRVIYNKAYKNGITNKPFETLSDKEIYSFILLPGFSTKEEVTEFSGRGVGLDVVVKKIEQIRGKVTIDSIENNGTTIIITIPLTMSIIDGMIIKVGNYSYTIPIQNIKQSIHIKNNDLIIDPEGNEMVLIRGKVYPVIRLYEKYKVSTNIKEIEDGIVVLIENDNKEVCLFADKLIGQQQVVIKELPKYIKNIKGIAGCTLLGDGSISLILDVSQMVNS